MKRAFCYMGVIAVLFLGACAVSPCLIHAQNKGACDLITKSDIESIMGFRVQEPQRGPIWVINSKNEKILFADEIASSGCSFKLSQPEAQQGTNSRIDIGVRYLRSTDAQGLQEKVKEDTPGATDLRMYYRRPFAYPALWSNVPSTVVVFKETANGTTVLQIRTFATPKSVTADKLLDYLLDQGVKLASKILGEAGKPPGIPNDQIIPADDTLKGQTAMAVEVILNDQPLSLSAQPQLDIEQMLRNNGIKIIRQSNTTTVSRLTLLIDSLFTPQLNGPGITVFTIRLEYRQVLPVQIQNSVAKYVEVPTWTAGTFGVNSRSDRYRNEALDLTSAFIKAYLKANGRK